MTEKKILFSLCLVFAIVFAPFPANAASSNLCSTDGLMDWLPIVPPKPRKFGEVFNSTTSVSFNLATREEVQESINFVMQQKSELGLSYVAPFQLPEVNPETVFPPDDRVKIAPTTSYPWRTICKIFVTAADDTQWMGSASIIGSSDNHGYHILTAGHCVYLHDHGGWAKSIKVVPGLDCGAMPYGYAWVTVARTYTGWTQYQMHEHDWAMCTLDRTIGDKTGWMGLLTASPSDPVYTGVLHTAGYPGDKDGGLCLYWDSDNGRTANEYNHWYYMDTAPGQSGSPVWFYNSSTSTYHILTIHAYGDDGSGSNYGTRLNQEKLDSILIWCSEDSPPIPQNPATFTTKGITPKKLAVYMGPPYIPATVANYYCVFVQLQDDAGNPAYAPESEGLSLTSDNATVGTVDPDATIPRGGTFVRTHFTTKGVAGTTVISVSSSKYGSGSATLIVMLPSLAPAKLTVYATPPQLPANEIPYSSTITVQLQEVDGTPAKAPSPGTTVNLTSSNPSVGTVTSKITIPTGSTFVQTSFTSTYLPGSTSITAVAAGYESGSATMTTFGPYIPKKIAVYVAPPSVPADSGTYSAVFVQLQDDTGNPAKAPANTAASLTSSDPSIGTVQPTVTIAAGSTYAIANFYSKYTPGSTVIRATAVGYEPGVAVMRTTVTMGIVPAQLSIYAGVPTVPADGGSHAKLVVVQLQDLQGNPAKAPESVSISLWSSNRQVGTVQTSITLSAGSTFGNAAFYSTYTPGSTMVVATTALVLSTLTLMVTPKTVNVGSPLTISGQLWPQISTTLYLYYRSGASPWTLATTITTKSDGSYSITVTIPSIPKGTYDLVAVWLGSKTYKGAVSEIRSFTVV